MSFILNFLLPYSMIKDFSRHSENSRPNHFDLETFGKLVVVGIICFILGYLSSIKKRW